MRGKIFMTKKLLFLHTQVLYFLFRSFVLTKHEKGHEIKEGDEVIEVIITARIILIVCSTVLVHL